MRETARCPVFGSTSVTSFFRDLLAHGLVLGARRDDPLALAPLEVDVDVAEAHRVGLRLRPVHVRPELALPEEHLEVGLLAVAARQRHEAVLDEPRVVVHRPPPRREAVVGEDDEDVVRAELLHRVADDGVHLLVGLLHGRRPLRGLRGVVRGVLRVEEAPEAVRRRGRGTRRSGRRAARPSRRGSRSSSSGTARPCASTSSRNVSSSIVSSLIDHVSICQPIVL